MFDKKQQSIIGVDIGTSSIKLIELARNQDGTFSLVTYGFVENAPRDLKQVNKEHSNQIATTIKSICAKAGTTTSHASAGLPTYVVFTSLISLPRMPKEELDSAVHWEAKKIIPLPLEDIILDYKVLNDTKKETHASLPFLKKDEKKEQEDARLSNEQEDLKILITGAAKETVARYTDIFSESALTLVSLETEMFALSRSLVGSEKGEIMIVEVGAAVTDIIIIEDGIPFLGRSIETGGNALTRAIMNSLNINEKRAEQLKRDMGLVNIEQAGGGGVPKILKDTIEPIVHEIKYTLELYKNHGVTPSSRATGSVEKIILTGGSAFLPHLAEYLSSALDMRVLIGDPWAHVQYPADLQPVLMGIGPKFSVAIGLAMRGL